ncbi:hypothetical protein [Maribacter sp. MAR_2009_72]|uniref:hypothetical protein n=1 Tax=Maribacter sp. MAR_2009_72 TaxID=1250050 RepID=UPI00119C2336|nr:hypothetical protein [Maribacter sp. MAR_2009_72]TVZ14202.1 hypothetical protein JM81_0403 [Maribacter sp. MAR_2009_72]
MDSLEKYIKENKAFFNDQKADRAKLWENIEAELSHTQPKVIPLWKSPLFKIAASILILIGITGILGSIFLGNNAQEHQFASQELRDIDMHYQGLVSYQIQLVHKNEQLSETDKAEFLSFIDELDQEYEELRLEMQNNLDNERVLEAIVANYRKRIELIENLLRQLNESKLKDEEYGYTL